MFRIKRRWSDKQWGRRLCKLGGKPSCDKGIPNITRLVYVACLGLLPLITLIMCKFMLPTEILPRAILVKALARGLVSPTIQLCLAFSISLSPYPAHPPLFSFRCLSLPTAVATSPLLAFHGLTFLCALQTKVNEQHNPEIVFQPAMVGRKIPWPVLAGGWEKIGNSHSSHSHFTQSLFLLLILRFCKAFLQ